jgi:acyl-CoA synthetase (AMP-forming)/AMP-acid ligase II
MIYAGTQSPMRGSDRPTLLHDRFLESATLHPRAVALVDGEDIWSFERLAQYVPSLLRGLIAQGVKEGDSVVRHLTNRVATIAAIYACMVTSAIAAPLNTRSSGPNSNPCCGDCRHR